MTKLYDRISDEITLDEIEQIAILEHHGLRKSHGFAIE